MAKQVTLSVKDSLDKLKKSMKNIGTEIESQINSAIKETAYSAYATIVAKAQSGLNTARQDYLKGLTFQDLGNNSFLISLEGDFANALEDGYAAYNLTAKLLASTKTVEVGSRSGESWVQTGKDGKKYAYVPFERHPTSKATGTSDMAQAIQAMKVKNANGRKQKITSAFKDASGNYLEGKVAIGRSENPMIDNLVKYQNVHTNEKGKQSLQSVYINYRAVSENGKPWIHPGFKGLKAFEEAEKDIVRQIDKIISILL